MRIRAVLFDWNGTVFDDFEAGVQAANHMFEYYGLPTISKHRFKKTFDVPWIIFYEKNGVKREWINISKHQKEYMKAYNSFSRKSKPRKNIRKVFEWLKKNKILIGIVSAHIQGDIEKSLKRHNLNKYLDVVIGEETKEEAGTTPNKKIKLALSRLKVSKNDVLYVGDTTHDMKIGRKEGFLTVGFVNGWQSKEILTKVKPDYLIEDMKEIIDIIILNK